MAFQLSPGVLVQEKDLTNVVPAVATTIGGIVGDFQWGPAHEIVSVSSENNLVERFGKPTLSVYYDHMTASSVFGYAEPISSHRLQSPEGALSEGLFRLLGPGVGVNILKEQEA